MGKIVNLDDIAYIKAVNALPKEYAIIVKREVGPLLQAEDWDETITWEVSDEKLDNSIGDILIFNHIMTVVHHMITSNEDLKEQFMDYIVRELNLEVIDNDSNFNK